MIFWIVLGLLFSPNKSHAATEASQALPKYEWTRLTDQGLYEYSLSEPEKFANATEVENEFKSLKIVKKKSTKAALSAQKFVIIGDTGCRIKDSKLIGGRVQDCNDPKAWPFEKVINQVNKENADLIIHVGDYHYRETCHAGHPCEAYSTVFGYGWKVWEADFFKPAQSALRKTPWIFVRGNHEDCGRAFVGYRYLLSQESSHGGACLDFEPTEFIGVGDLLIVNFDSSSVSEFPDISEEKAKIWQARFEEIDHEVERRKPKFVWMISHKPSYGFAPLAGGYAPVNVNLKKLIESSPLKSKINLLLSGHVHTSALIEAGGPLQVISGNAGSALDSMKTKFNFKTLGYQGVYTSAEEGGFGYTVISRGNGKQKDQWTIEAKGIEGKVQARCTQDLKKIKCKKI